MASTIPEYVVPLIQRQAAATDLLGISIMSVDPQAYRMNLTVLTLFGVVMKALNDHGIVPDAEWLSRLDSALAGSWPDWLLNQIDPNAPIIPGQ